jgi:zinc transporter
MSDSDGLIFACELDGNGGGRQVTWPEVEAWRPGGGTLWVHLDRSGPSARKWIEERSGLDRLACEALLAEETRPRASVHGRGLLVNLRGVNLNPGADPEDMVSLRMWIEPGRIITVRLHRLMAVQDVRSALEAGTGPCDGADFLATIATRLLDRMGPVIDDLEDGIDSIEDELLESPSLKMRGRLTSLRRQAIGLRRYIAPQRDAMARLMLEPVPWFDELHRARLREVADRVTRYVEDLDAARERATVAQEEISMRIAEQMNKTIYILSLVAAIFLPLGLLTGLLGINVAGIPGANYHFAFYIVCAILVAVAAIQAWVFRRMRWF